MEFDIDICEEGISLPFENLKKKDINVLLKKIADLIIGDKVSISLILTDNEFIKNLNNEFRNKDYPTDIITFSYRENPFPFCEDDKMIEHLGDIYISLEKALENSIEYNVEFNNEIKRLLVHGMLHLLGYDHEKSESDEKIMFEKEDEILKQI